MNTSSAASRPIYLSSAGFSSTRTSWLPALTPAFWTACWLPVLCPPALPQQMASLKSPRSLPPCLQPLLLLRRMDETAAPQAPARTTATAVPTGNEQPAPRPCATNDLRGHHCGQDPPGRVVAGRVRLALQTGRPRSPSGRDLHPRRRLFSSAGWQVLRSQAREHCH